MDHQKRGLVPKGIWLDRNYNPVLLDYCPNSTVDRIENVLSKADWEIQKIMVGHYSELIGGFTDKV